MGVWDDISLGLENIGRGIEELGEDAVRATREFTQIQKLKGEASAAKRQVNTMYLRMGKRYYEEHRDDPEAEKDPLMRAAAENLQKAADCEAQIAQLKSASEEQKASAGEASAAEKAAKDAEAMERQEQGMDPEVVRANAEDDIVDYQPVEPAEESDFEEE